MLKIFPLNFENICILQIIPQLVFYFNSIFDIQCEKPLKIKGFYCLLFSLNAPLPVVLLQGFLAGFGIPQGG